MREPSRHGVANRVANRSATLAAAAVLALSACTGAPSTAPSFHGTMGPIVTPAPATATTAPSPSETVGADAFPILPGHEPAGFGVSVECEGTIDPAAPVAVVELKTADPDAQGEVVLRDFSAGGDGVTVCTFANAGPYSIRQLIDPHHVVIDGSGHVDEAGMSAVVELPSGRMRWFQLPRGEDMSSEFVGVAPDLGSILWTHWTLESETEVVNLSTAAGDAVVESYPLVTFGRCGSPEDSDLGAFSRSGNYAYVLRQHNIPENTLLVLEGTTKAMAMAPPTEGWPDGGHPAMVLWSPVDDVLFFRRGGDVFRWESGAAPTLAFPGVNWFHPTISPDGSTLVYSTIRKGGGHDVYRQPLDADAGPELLEEQRGQPVFLSSDLLWYLDESDIAMCGLPGGVPKIRDMTTGTDRDTEISLVVHAWPGTSSNH